MLGCCWMFALFLSRLGRCFTQVQMEFDSAPTYLAAIFPFFSFVFSQLQVLHLEKKKKPPADLKPESLFCWSSWMLQTEGGWSLFSSFPVVLRKWGLSLGYNIHRCPVSSPCPNSAVQPMLYSALMLQVIAYNLPHYATL